jgi:hypothetical protein
VESSTLPFTCALGQYQTAHLGHGVGAPMQAKAVASRGFLAESALKEEIEMIWRNAATVVANGEPHEVSIAPLLYLPR